MEVLAVGTGQALALGAKGDADVLLVHAPSLEAEFVAAGDGTGRSEVMYNDFIIVGPAGDPAGIEGLASAKEAFAKIAGASAPFASRGDDSGTHGKEKGIWASAEIEPDARAGWYFSIGQGMGETLIFADEKRAYALTDRGTWLARRDKLPHLVVLVGGDTVADNPDPGLLNPYGVIPVSPAKHPGVNLDLANHFVEWITSLDVQQQIFEFGRDSFDQPLFYPASQAWVASQD